VYEHIDFAPPEGVRVEARRGLDWRDEYGRGGTEVGVARARDLSNGRNVSPETARRMASYFARHEVDKQGEGFSPGEPGFPSAGRIAWALWGGDPGQAWSSKLVTQMDAAERAGGSMDDDIRSMAAEVPVYVRPEGERWALVASETGAVLSEHDSERQALAAALEGEEAPLRAKRAVLRTDGVPDGVWRWLDASAVEDAPIDGVRITARALWEMAASLNRRATPVPVNGGGAPSGEHAESAPHGDARSGGDHPANGWAHAAAIVVDEAGREHLFLYAELVPQVAREVDRGRLAFGSVFFAFESVDAERDHAVSGATLISHALTNDPAVTTLTAGSERNTHVGALTASRTRKVRVMTQKKVRRGAAYDALETLASDAGVSIEDEMTADAESSPLIERIEALKAQAVVEETLESIESTPAEEAPAEVEAQRAAREEMGLTPEESASMLAWARDVLGKPDATPADALAELGRRKDEVAALLGEDAAPDSMELGAGYANDEDEDEKNAKGARSRNPLRAVRRELASARGRIERFEVREWLRSEIEKRRLGVSPAKRQRYEDMALKAGREVVLEILEGLATPPSGNPLPQSQESAPPSLDVAARSLLPEIAKQHPTEPHHFHVARSLKAARARWPQLGEKSGAA
jgi:hypothetical protein